MKPILSVFTKGAVAVLMLPALSASPAAAGLCDPLPVCGDGGGPSPAPEIDPNVARSLLTVLVAGGLVLAGGRPRS